MKQIPILFSTLMVQALLDGRKTMIRRVNGLSPVNENPSDWQFEWGLPMENKWRFTQKSTVNEQTLADKSFTQLQLSCRYGKPGDILWVRESITYMSTTHYVADNPDRWILAKKIPSIHMPKSEARIWLEVVSVKVQRVQDISEKDAIAEGVELEPPVPSDDHPVYKNYIFPTAVCASAAKSFRTLWESINGLGSWNDNPWVWVVEFKVLSNDGKPEGI